MSTHGPYRRRFRAALTVALMLAGGGAVQATEAAQAKTAAGVAIADAGNRALARIRRELAQTLIEDARPQLPIPATRAAPALRRKTPQLSLADVGASFAAAAP